MTIEIRPITAEIGAELTGIDLGRPLAAEAIATISRALHDHLVLVFRNQQMNEDEHIGFARQFGEIQPPPLKTHYDANPLLHVLGRGTLPGRPHRERGVGDVGEEIDGQLGERDGPEGQHGRHQHRDSDGAVGDEREDARGAQLVQGDR